MGRGGYHGGSTVITFRSGWFGTGHQKEYSEEERERLAGKKKKNPFSSKITLKKYNGLSDEKKNGKFNKEYKQKVGSERTPAITQSDMERNRNAARAAMKLSASETHEVTEKISSGAKKSVNKFLFFVRRSAKKMP